MRAALVLAIALALAGCTESPERRAARITAECRAIVKAAAVTTYGEGFAASPWAVGKCIAARGAQ